MQGDDEYYKVRKLTASIRGREIAYFSKPGMPGGDKVTPAEVLLAEEVPYEPDLRVLLFGSGHGALAAALSDRMPFGQIEIADPNLISLRMTAETLQAHRIDIMRFRLDCGFWGVDPIPVDGLPVELAADHDARQQYDAVLILLPKGRSVSRRWLLEAKRVLRTGGKLYLAGAKDEGIGPAGKDAESIFGKGGVLAYKKGSRVIQFKHGRDLPLPDWAQEPGTAPGTWKEFTVPTQEHVYRVKSLPGVFAAGHLDEGTDMLLEHIIVKPGSTVLDLGSGYGILGMAAVGAAAGQVDFTDASLAAAASTSATLQENDLPADKVCARDVLEGAPTEGYDHIITNPPFHSGHEVQYSMSDAIIHGAKRVLRPGGRLTLVANRFIRYDRLMKSVFGNVTDLAHTGKFHVLEAVRERDRRTGSSDR